MFKKKLIWTSLILLLFLVVACSTTRKQQNSYYNYPEYPFLCSFSISSVIVTVDHVVEKDIAAQILSLAEAYLEQLIVKDASQTETFLKINIIQRSYMEGISQYNALYISAELTLKDGTLIARENVFQSGKATIVSAVEQHERIIAILDSLTKTQKERYTEIQKEYAKKNE